MGLGVLSINLKFIPINLSNKSKKWSSREKILILFSFKKKILHTHNILLSTLNLLKKFSLGFII